MTIDLETGLPALKEGQFWRVREQKASQWFTTSTQDAVKDYAVVELIERITVEKSFPRYFLNMQFGYLPPVEVHEEIILSMQVLWHQGLPVPDDHTGYAIRIDGERYFTVHPSEVEPKMILAAAEKALEAYEHTQKARKLLGDYPPKTLEGIDA